MPIMPDFSHKPFDPRELPQFAPQDVEFFLKDDSSKNIQQQAATLQDIINLLNEFKKTHSIYSLNVSEVIGTNDQLLCALEMHARSLHDLYYDKVFNTILFCHQSATTMRRDKQGLSLTIDIQAIVDRSIPFSNALQELGKLFFALSSHQEPEMIKLFCMEEKIMSLYRPSEQSKAKTNT